MLLSKNEKTKRIYNLSKSIKGNDIGFTAAKDATENVATTNSVNEVVAIAYCSFGRED